VAPLERERGTEIERVCVQVCVGIVRCWVSGALECVCTDTHTHVSMDRPQVPRVGESECNEADPGGRGLGESDLTLGNKPLRFCHVSRAFWHQEGFRV
jgi:hypothetical protein